LHDLLNKLEFGGRTAGIAPGPKDIPTTTLTHLRDRINLNAHPGIHNQGGMPMPRDDSTYFLKRAAQELVAAERATSAAAGDAHHALARLYLAAIENHPRPVFTRMPAAENQLSA
jgi:hypothetical protein